MASRPVLSDMQLRIASAVARRHAWLADRSPVLEVADLRQEALLAIWLWEAANPDDPAGPTLAREIARRACLKAARRARGSGRGCHAGAAPPAGLHAYDPATPPPDLASPADVRDAIGRLTPALAGTARRKLAGVSNREAAADDGVSIATIETRVHRTFAALRDSLAAYAPDAS
jgi:DNA-directed RNA polymerase specialized sigma24 family protein